MTEVFCSVSQYLQADAYEVPHMYTNLGGGEKNYLCAIPSVTPQIIFILNLVQVT
jgi:hypothetical protein